MHALTPPGICASTIPIVCYLFLTGCSTPKPPRAGGHVDISFWQPYLMYILATPHSRLYVEVDAVEGCAPSEVTLNKLRDLLTAHCDKPEGIQIVRSDVIPIKAARGISRTSLSRKFLDGPAENVGTSPPAFMYVLFYDGKLCDQPAVGEVNQVGASAASHPPERNKNPHVDLLPYPAAIFMNTRVGAKSIRDEMLLHEAGHLLGLAGRPIGATSYHCLDETCLMYTSLTIHIGRLLTFRDPITQKKYCEQCVAQLTESSRRAAPSNPRFVGPVLARSEAGYHVLSLPSRVKLIVGDLTEQDCQDFAAAVRAETPLADVDSNALRLDAFVKVEMRSEPAKVRDIINRAKADPFDHVRSVASRLDQMLPSE